MPKSPDDGQYELTSYKPEDCPRGDISVRLTPEESRRVRRLLARLRGAGKTTDRRRVRDGLIRIVGRETIELIEASRRPDQTLNVRLIPEAKTGPAR